jgi:hypothetical protein
MHDELLKPVSDSNLVNRDTQNIAEDKDVTAMQVVESEQFAMDSSTSAEKISVPSLGEKR